MPPLGNILPGRPWYYGLIIGLVGLAVLIAAVHFLLVVDIDKQIASANTELDELQKRIEAGRSAQKKLPQFREEVRRLEDELDKLRRILPSTRNTEEIIKKIKALVDQGNLGLKDLKFPDPVASGDSEVYRDWNISVIVEGTYHNLAILFDRLSNFSRIVNVEKFEITALNPQGEKTISASFVARTFVYVEQEAAPADAAAGGAAGGPKSKPGGAE
jgi:type IV pilus assembly protein PilO